MISSLQAIVFDFDGVIADSEPLHLQAYQSVLRSNGIDLSRVVLGTGRVERDAVLLASYTSHWDFFQTQTEWP